MIVLIALHAKVSIFSEAVKLGRVGWNLGTVIAKRGFRLLFFVCVNHIINDINGKHLVIFKYDVLMLKDLWILVLVVQVN